jgi:hypothetical protein
MKVRALAALLGVAGLGLLVAPAQASTLVGSPLTGTIGSGSRDCTPACTDINTVLPDSGANLTSPFDGVIVRWRMIGNSGATSFRLRIVHPEGGGQFTGVGASSEEVPMGVGPTTFPTRLPIAAGDMLGINIHGGVSWSGNAVGVTGAEFVSVQPTLTDGPPPQMPNFTVNDLESGVNADVEPDADGDGFGDETQDGCPTNASSQAPCPAAPVAPVTPKKKCKKQKKHHSAETAKKKCKKKKKHG